MRSVLKSVAALAALGLTHVAFAAPAKDNRPKFEQMDYGPFLSASFISSPTSEFDNGPGSFTADSTARGIIVQLQNDWQAGIVFDADTMRMSAGWHGGGLWFRGLIGDGDHGWDPMPRVLPAFQTPNGPGWANAAGSFEDPRADSIKPLPRPGPLPHAWAHYRGLYRHGREVIFAYTVNGAEVLERPAVETHGAATAFVRTINVKGATGPNAVMIADGEAVIPVPKPKRVKEKKKDADGTVKETERVIEPDPKLMPKPRNSETKVDGMRAELGDLHVAVVGAPKGAPLVVDEHHRLSLKFPKQEAAAEFRVLVCDGGAATAGDFDEILKAQKKVEDLSALTKGGPSLWAETVETKGVLAKPPAEGKKPEPYVVDNLTVPLKNPYNSWMRIGAFDFFPDGKRAALTTWSGDVWVVSGIDAGLEHLVWKRFATGLHQPLGCRIVDGTVYVVGHDQITRLHDLDGDGEADFYENFNNDWELTSAFHAFAFDLQTDAAGNFYFAFGSPVHAGGPGFQKITKDHGTIFKVSKDGSKIEHYAEGLRAPNGMCVGPDGQVTIGDNQGSWVPYDPLHWVKPGQFLGVTSSAHREMKSTDQKADAVEMPKPLCWLIYPKFDNSCGGQAWVTDDRWGPFKGELLYCSYGQSALYKVLKDEVNGVVQGGVTRFNNVRFTSSAMRPRFNPADGQLYVTGLKGWQTNAAGDGGFDRVRYTGAPVVMPTGLHATKKGIAITFTQPLETASANDAGSFDVEAWNIRWSSAYGSPKVSAYGGQGEAEAVKQLDVKSATLSADGKTVFLELPEIRPVHCMHITMHLNAADGSPVNCEIGNTIHELAEK